MKKFFPSHYPSSDMLPGYEEFTEDSTPAEWDPHTNKETQSTFPQVLLQAHQQPIEPPFSQPTSSSHPFTFPTTSVNLSSRELTLLNPIFSRQVQRGYSQVSQLSQPSVPDPLPGVYPPAITAASAQHPPSAFQNPSGGYGFPAGRPVPAGTVSTLTYLNRTGYKVDNKPISSALSLLCSDLNAQNKIKQFTKATGLLVYYCQIDNKVIITPFGTGVLVNPNQIITAKHALRAALSTTDNLNNLYMAFGYETNTANSPLFRVVHCNWHPTEDIAVLTLIGNPGLYYTPVKIEFDEQPRGEYWIVHHAGSLPAQLSIGEFAEPGGNLFQIANFELLINAGPLSSGAGVFNHVNASCIGIVIRRSTELGHISRKLLCFHQVKNELTACLNQTLTHSGVFTPTATLLLENYIDHRMYSEELYGNAIETNTFSRIKIHIREYREFLIELYKFINNKISSINIPNSLSFSIKLDSHQPQHFIPYLRKDKTLLHDVFGTNSNHEILQAFASLISSLYWLYFHRVKDDEKKELLLTEIPKMKENVAFDFGFNLARDIQHGNKRKDEFYLIFIDGGYPPGEFHFYPEKNYNLDRKTKVKLSNTEIINVEKLFQYFETY